MRRAEGPRAAECHGPRPAVPERGARRVWVCDLGGGATAEPQGRRKPRRITLGAGLCALVTALVAPALARAQGAALARGSGASLRDAYTHVRVLVEGDLARTTVTQVFVNDGAGDVEGTYRFPLPADAAVTGFADWRDGRRVEARAADREDATRRYEAAAAAGKRAALAESDGESRFQMHLLPIPAHGTRRIELRYAQTLAALGGERSYVFPGDRTSAQPAPTLLDVEVLVSADRPLLGAAAPNHPDARLDRDGPSRLALRLSRVREGLGTDLVLRWQQQTTDLDLAARAVRARTGEPGYVEARLAFDADPLGAARSPLDCVLVVDTSLSMAGEPLARAVALGTRILGQLGPTDRVQLVSFDDAVRSALSGLEPADPARLARLRGALGALRPGGRSNLQAAIDQAADLVRGSPAGLVVLMTDGQPTVGSGVGADGEATLGARRPDFARSRVVLAHFNYPVRRAAMEALFPSVVSRYVPDGPAGEAALGELSRLATAPVIEDLEMHLEGAGVTSLQGSVPRALALGDAVRLLARAQGDLLVRVRGRLHGRPLERSLRVAMPAAPDAAGDRGLPVEWARLRVRDLEARLGGAGVPAGEARALETEIRGLGREYGLVTRFTSYVTTETEADSLSPDRIKPGDPEIRVHAPRSALAVRGLLPWGEVIECVWQEEEGLWLGRFLVPRGVAAGLYRVPVFVETQGGVRHHGTLLYRVDDQAPAFVLEREGSGPVARGARVRLLARPRDGVYEGRALATRGDVVVRDRIDLRHIVVRLGDAVRPLVRAGVGERWETELVCDLPPGRHLAHLYATDFAGNTSEAELAIEVR